MLCVPCSAFHACGGVLSGSSPAFAGRSIAVIEAKEPPSASVEELAASEKVDLRVFAIAAASQRAFQGDDRGVVVGEPACVV